MILEVVENAELVRHEVEAEDAVLELLVVVNIGALVAAACQDRVEQEDRETTNDEDWVLEEIHDEVHFQLCSIRIVQQA